MVRIHTDTAPRDSTWAKLINVPPAKSPSRTNTQTNIAHASVGRTLTLLAAATAFKMAWLSVACHCWCGRVLGINGAALGDADQKTGRLHDAGREHRQIQISVVAESPGRVSRISASRCACVCAPIKSWALAKDKIRKLERENCRAGLSPLTWYEAEKSWPDYPIHDVISVILQVLSSPICNKQTTNILILL